MAKKLMNRISLIAVILSILFVGCLRHTEKGAAIEEKVLASPGLLTGNEKKSMVGLWYLIDVNSVYFEMIYTDTLFWCFTEEAGLLLRTYKLEENILTRYYLMDGSEDLKIRIIDESPNSIKYTFENGQGEQFRIKHNYDLLKIVNEDSVARANYIWDYIKRKHDWEKDHIRPRKD